MHVCSLMLCWIILWPGIYFSIYGLSEWGVVGCFIIRPWLSVLCCCFPLIVLIARVMKLGLRIQVPP